jgi:hypothetical protein
MDFLQAIVHKYVHGWRVTVLHITSALCNSPFNWRTISDRRNVIFDIGTKCLEFCLYSWIIRRLLFCTLGSKMEYFNGTFRKKHMFSKRQVICKAQTVSLQLQILCSLVQGYQRFGGIRRFDLQGTRYFYLEGKRTRLLRNDGNHPWTYMYVITENTAVLIFTSVRTPNLILHAKLMKLCKLEYNSKIVLFWVTIPCGFVGKLGGFGATYCLPLQGWRISYAYLSPKLCPSSKDLNTRTNLLRRDYLKSYIWNINLERILWEKGEPIYRHAKIITVSITDIKITDRSGIIIEM